MHHYKSSFYIVHRMNQNGSMQICAIYFISRSLKSLLHTLIKYFFFSLTEKFQWSPLCRVILFIASSIFLKMHTFVIRYKEMIMRYGLPRTMERNFYSFLRSINFSFNCGNQEKMNYDFNYHTSMNNRYVSRSFNIHFTSNEFV